MSLTLLEEVDVMCRPAALGGRGVGLARNMRPKRPPQLGQVFLIYCFGLCLHALVDLRVDIGGKDTEQMLEPRYLGFVGKFGLRLSPLVKLLVDIVKRLVLLAE